MAVSKCGYPPTNNRPEGTPVYRPGKTARKRVGKHRRKV